MNAENFVEYLQDYSKLYQIPYEELKSLVMQYPYCSNLHYLLLEKSQLDQHKDLDENLRTASFYSQDRAALRKLIQQLKVTAARMESFELAEDYLELKDLSAMEKPVEPLVIEELAEQEEQQDNFIDFLPQLDQDTEWTPGEEEEPSEEEEKAENTTAAPPIFSTDNGIEEKKPEEGQPPAPPPSQQAGEGLEDLFEAFMADMPVAEDSEKPADETTDTEPDKTEEETPGQQLPPPRPTPKSSFTSWVQQFQPAHIKVQLSELMESKKREDAKRARKKKKKRKDKVILFAEQSLQERPDLASETLAELLIAQEQYEKAIQMYERLILKFPEKSSYFAEKIKNLKKQ